MPPDHVHSQDSADWIAVDWGTSALRVWRMRGAQALDTRRSAAGMGTLRPDGFEPALLDLIADWLGDQPMPVLACGMVGAKQGWSEAGYRAVPCAALGAPFHSVRPAHPGFDLHIVPGLSQAAPADVMRGEETQIAGYLALHPGFAGTIGLPGTHMKWAQVAAGQVTGFTTTLTGEMFALLSGQSVLRHGLGAGWEAEAFAEGVCAMRDAPQRFAADLFGIRARGLLGQESPDAARARLSGLVIGLDLAAVGPFRAGQPVVLIGEGGLADLYAEALALSGVAAEKTSGDAITLAGLTRAHALLQETHP